MHGHGTALRIGLTGGIASGKSTVAGAVRGARRAGHRPGLRSRARWSRRARRAARARGRSASARDPCARPTELDRAARCASSYSRTPPRGATSRPSCIRLIRERTAQARARRAVHPMSSSSSRCWWRRKAARGLRSGAGGGLRRSAAARAADGARSEQPRPGAATLAAQATRARASRVADDVIVNDAQLEALVLRAPGTAAALPARWPGSLAKDVPQADALKHRIGG